MTQPLPTPPQAYGPPPGYGPPPPGYGPARLWDQPYRQCLHDKLAGTIVVKVTPWQ